MKKTEYSMLVSAGFYKNEIVRRVWVDEKGHYFVKYNGEFKDVTFAKENFLRG